MANYQLSDTVKQEANAIPREHLEPMQTLPLQEEYLKVHPALDDLEGDSNTFPEKKTHEEKKSEFQNYITVWHVQISDIRQLVLHASSSE
jgi:hypothetical protein